MGQSDTLAESMPNPSTSKPSVYELYQPMLMRDGG